MAEIRLSSAASADISRILRQTYTEYGEHACARYEALIATAFRDLATDSQRNGALPRPELGAHIFSYHMRYSRDRARHIAGLVRRPRHLILFRRIEPEFLDIGRILHDAMELTRHLPQGF